MVECGGLENRCTARYRGFESLPLRQLKFTAGYQLSSRMSLVEKRSRWVDDNGWESTTIGKRYPGCDGVRQSAAQSQ